jgi:hypothetical protein
MPFFIRYENLKSAFSPMLKLYQEHFYFLASLHPIQQHKLPHRVIAGKAPPK